MIKQLKFLLVAAVVIGFASCLDVENSEEVIYSPQNEADLISDYLDSATAHGFVIDTTMLGTYVIDMDTTNRVGDYPSLSDSVGVGYVGYFVTGGVFDASDLYKLRLQDPTGSNLNLIKGFYDAIFYMELGDKGTFLLPSSMAYGSTGYSKIPPYTPIIFQIELKRNYTQEAAAQ